MRGGGEEGGRSEYLAGGLSFGCEWMFVVYILTFSGYLAGLGFGR